MAKHLKKTVFSSLFFGILCIELFSLLPKGVFERELKSHFQIPQTTQNQSQTIPFTASGLIHVHPPTLLGKHPFEWMKFPAEKADLNFIIASQKGERELQEQHLGNTDFFIEDEVQIPDGDLLVFHSHGIFANTHGRELKNAVLSALEGKTASRDLFSIIARPSHIHSPWNRFDRFPEGISVFNLESQWIRELYDSPFSFIGSLSTMPFNQFLGILKLLHPFQKNFSSWDGMNALSPGHFGVISHDFDLTFGFLEGGPLHEFFLEKSFKIAKNILFLKEPLSSDFKERKKQIYSAIQEGRSALLLSVLYPFEGNDWSIECRNGTLYRSGSTLSLDDSCRFLFKIHESFPYQATFKLFRNGELYIEKTSNKDFDLPVTQLGTYRLEIWAKTRTFFGQTLSNGLLSSDTPYLFYNPIYVRGKN